eukprot:CAMPEP_0197406586 /NCGR_PEP_ID=MMETSP1165-20131217/25970_1 /TAXON_ID=284809 /ORGANISM="Chrysocystis fragilis, Strain CCMP3189" /LENGTH=39 /DNA_ID= /DNA_START= /DNA_END= /DNA_ORIENTATION=
MSNQNGDDDLTHTPGPIPARYTKATPPFAMLFAEAIIIT